MPSALPVMTLTAGLRWNVAARCPFLRSRPRPRALLGGSEFRAIQAKRGAKGGKIGSGSNGGKVSKGGGRPSKAVELLPEVIRLKAMGYSNRDIAQDLGIGSASVSRYLSKISPE